MYGLIALFDNITEQFIKNIWSGLKENFISSYAYEVEDRRPHITIASYNHLDVDKFISQINAKYKSQPAIDIKLSTLGSFLNSGTLFLAPTITRDLNEFHSKHHTHFQVFNDNPNSIYLPNHWIPHCTLANRLSPQKLTEAFSFCSKLCSERHGKITEIALIDVSVKSKAPIIYSIKLT
ncbi:2'-5' RNA ligase family protein [Falsibacillus pallidus]|uniref:2'-5' RNA ligase family protein n=1 Tax=Falsibacillus pallidus TaxID=493781 RepID=UPI003D95481D